MSGVEAVSSSPTRGVPPIVGAPVAGVFGSGPSSAGPATVVEIPSDSERPSEVQIAAGVPQAAPAASVTVTSASESGSTVSSHRSLRRFTRPADVARPPDTATTSSRNRRPFIMLSRSLNAILSVNALPSCSDGTFSNLAVSGSSAAATTSVAALVRLSSLPASSVKSTRTLRVLPSSASTAV